MDGIRFLFPSSIGKVKGGEKVARQECGPLRTTECMLLRVSKNPKDALTEIS